MSRRRTFVQWLLLALVAIAPMGVARGQTSSGAVAYEYPNQYGGSDVHVIIPGSGDRRVSPQIVLDGVNAGTPASLSFPVWSRKGRLMAGAALLAGAPTQKLVIFDPIQNVGVTSSRWPSSKWAIFTAFSPDGSRVAYSAVDGSTEIGIVDINTKTKTVLGTMYGDLSGMGIDWSPKVSTDGDVLVLSLQNIVPSCVGTPTYAVQLFRTVVKNGTVTSLTPITAPPPQLCLLAGETEDTTPAFSPDGSTVAFARYVPPSGSGFGTWSLNLVGIDGSNPRPLVTFNKGYMGWRPRWSASGTQLVFDVMQLAYGTAPARGLGVYAVNANGTGGITQFLSAPASGAYPKLGDPLS